GHGRAGCARGPGPAVRVVLERVEVACLGAELERDPGDLTGRAGMVGRELAAVGGLLEAPATRSDHDGGGGDLVLAAPRPPAVLGRLECRQRTLRQRRAGTGLPRLAQPGRDRVPRAVADLEQPFTAGT